MACGFVSVLIHQLQNIPVTEGAAFLKAMTGLCNDLGIATIAEMVEEDFFALGASDQDQFAERREVVIRRRARCETPALPVSHRYGVRSVRGRHQPGQQDAAGKTDQSRGGSGGQVEPEGSGQIPGAKQSPGRPAHLAHSAHAVCTDRVRICEAMASSLGQALT